MIQGKPISSIGSLKTIKILEFEIGIRIEILIQIPATFEIEWKLLTQRTIYGSPLY